MIKVITVEREYGSRGGQFAHHLADALGWKLVDQCLVDEIARVAGIPAQQASHCDERLDPWYYRFGKTFWHGSIERLPALDESKIFDAERMAGLARDYLHQVAETGHCVIVGRGSSCALQGFPGAYHIFVYTSLRRKLEWFKSAFPQHARLAEQELAATDKRRSSYVKRFYERDWADRHLYHLMINSCAGFDAMVQATLAAAGLEAKKSTEEASPV